MDDPDLNQFDFNTLQYPSFLQPSTPFEGHGKPVTQEWRPLIEAQPASSAAPESPSIQQSSFPVADPSPPKPLVAPVDVGFNVDPWHGARPVAPSPSSMGPPLPKPRKPKAPTLRPEQWQPYKDDIIRLHIDEGQPLHQVMDIMSREHGFTAEKRQYETILKKWNTRKKIRSSEMKPIVRKIIKRNLVDVHKKPLECRVDGKVVDPKKIERFMKEKRIPSSILYMSPASMPTPAGVTCRTMSTPGTPPMSSASPFRVPASPGVRVSPMAQTFVPPSPALSDMSILGSDPGFVGESPHPFIVPGHWNPATTTGQPEGRQHPFGELMEMLLSENPLPMLDVAGTEGCYKYEDETRLRDDLQTNNMLHGPGNPATMHTAAALAQVFVDQGRYRKADQTLRDSLLGCRGAGLASEIHVETWRLYGKVLRLQGRLSHSKRLLEKLSHSVASSSSSPNSCSARILADWAKTLMELGLYEDAEKTIRQAVEFSKISRSPVEDVCEQMRIWSCVAHDRGKWEEAVKIAEEALRHSTTGLGHGNVETLTCKARCASIFVDIGKWEEAWSLAKGALDACTRTCGPENPTTVSIAKAIVRISRVTGNWNDAQRLARWIATVLTKILGPDHPETLAGIVNVGSILCLQDNAEEAVPLLQHAIRRYCGTLGDDHPATLESKNELYCGLLSQGKFEEARKLGAEVLEKQRVLFGESHTYTIISMFNATHHLVDPGAALEAVAKIVATTSRAWGSKHHRTLFYTAEQVRLFVLQRKYREACSLGEKVVSNGIEVRGESHPYTLVAMLYYGEGLAGLGRTDEAVRILSRGLKLSEERLGPVHRQTRWMREALERV